MSDTALGAHQPLISPRFIYRLTACAVAMALGTAALNLVGRTFGDRLALAGHSSATTVRHLLIGPDRIAIADNHIRPEDQRRDGVTERLDLYATWPSMQGYSTENRRLFDDVTHPESLIFLQISQSTMSRDMSGRLEPIYRQLFDGAPQPAPAGLIAHHLKPGTGYGDDVFYTGRLESGADYVVRCLPASDEIASTGADCMRDIHIGNDLVLLYRFSARLLPQWQAIEKKVSSFVTERLNRP
ncbi:hypothetical protein SAMN05880582_101838 [Rhizobium sp. RU20A]|uniref:hypothetical protein n=1 Tax=Rhizobium sp. RU20A TaxID=1907412 RepID=UPI000956F7E3|nr:hypothetical protein [Rhizobium sp. RU20A]SIQ12685.1 hypothetical protein SAMN05880582_101838 [Rhizobium sp. RU20A]